MMASLRATIACLGLLGLAALSDGCSREEPAAGHADGPRGRPLPASFKTVPPAEAEMLMASRTDLSVLDLRTEKEWAEEGRLPKATLVNYFRANLRAHLAGLDRKRPYLLYCAIGGRARLAAEEMAELGFTEVYLLEGGLNAWKAEGKLVVK